MTYATRTAIAATARRDDRSLGLTALAALIGLLSLVSVESAFAQGRGNGNRGRDGIPPGQMPRAGECRVWYDNVPPGRQPAPTSCENARATVARNGGRVIYGDDARGNARRDDSRDDARYDRDCSAKDERKGKCEYDRRSDDRRGNDRRADDRRNDDRRYPNGTADRYPARTGDRTRGTDGRYPDNRYPDSNYPNGTYPGSGNPNSGYPNGSYPRTLPDMTWAVEYSRGNRVAEARQWVGEENRRVSYTDSNRDGRPETATFADFAGRIIQRWNDDNGDGRADRVTLYENNKPVRVIQ